MIRDSAVGITTRHGLDGPGIESLWRRDFPHPSIPALGPNQTLIQRVPGLFPRGKVAGACRWPLTPSCAKVKERVLHLYSPSGPSLPILGWTLLLLQFLSKICQTISSFLKFWQHRVRYMKTYVHTWQYLILGWTLLYFYFNSFRKSVKQF